VFTQSALSANFVSNYLANHLFMADFVSNLFQNLLTVDEWRRIILVVNETQIHFKKFILKEKI